MKRGAAKVTALRPMVRLAWFYQIGDDLFAKGKMPRKGELVSSCRSELVSETAVIGKCSVNVVAHCSHEWQRTRGGADRANTRGSVYGRTDFFTGRKVQAPPPPSLTSEAAGGRAGRNAQQDGGNVAVAAALPPAAASSGGVRCPGCGKLFKNLKALGGHKKGCRGPGAMIVGAGAGWGGVAPGMETATVSSTIAVAVIPPSAAATDGEGSGKGVGRGEGGGKGGKEWMGSDTTSAASSDVALSDAD